MARTALQLGSDEMRLYRPRTGRAPQVSGHSREVAWGVARGAARLLQEKYGAKRVVAFGSLVHGAWFGPTSDIDLAAWGIPADRYYRAVAEVITAGKGFEVDLVDPADCRLSVRRDIEHEGVDL